MFDILNKKCLYIVIKIVLAVYCILIIHSYFFNQILQRGSEETYKNI